MALFVIIPCFFAWHSYLKTDCNCLLVLFPIKDQSTILWQHYEWFSKTLWCHRKKASSGIHNPCFHWTKVIGVEEKPWALGCLLLKVPYRKLTLMKFLVLPKKWKKSNQISWILLWFQSSFLHLNYYTTAILK